MTKRTENPFSAGENAEIAEGIAATKGGSRQKNGLQALKIPVNGGAQVEKQNNINEKRKVPDSRSYHRSKMQKELIIERLKDKGCRITKQRLTLLDIILEHECSSCKEIYYKASRVDDSIGAATVYRMVNVLEEIGAISRKNMYKIAYSETCSMEDACTVVLDDETTYHLSAKNWNSVVRAGLTACGYLNNQKITSITVKPCECENAGCL